MTIEIGLKGAYGLGVETKYTGEGNGFKTSRFCPTRG